MVKVIGGEWGDDGRLLKVESRGRGGDENDKETVEWFVVAVGKGIRGCGECDWRIAGWWWSSF